MAKQHVRVMPIARYARATEQKTLAFTGKLTMMNRFTVTQTSSHMLATMERKKKGKPMYEKKLQKDMVDFNDLKRFGNESCARKKNRRAISAMASAIKYIAVDLFLPKFFFKILLHIIMDKMLPIKPNMLIMTPTGALNTQ